MFSCWSTGSTLRAHTTGSVRESLNEAYLHNVANERVPRLDEGVVIHLRDGAAIAADCHREFENNTSGYEEASHNLKPEDDHPTRDSSFR